MGPLAGFTGVVHELERRWRSTPDEEIRAIVGRAWPAMRDLDEATFDEATGPAIRALEALPRADISAAPLQR